MNSFVHTIKTIFYRPASFFAMALLILLSLFVSQPVQSATILVYYSSCDGGLGPTLLRVSQDLALTNTVTTIDVGCNTAYNPGGTATTAGTNGEIWSNFQQVWDVRFYTSNQGCTGITQYADYFGASWQSTAQDYVANYCGNLFLLGENSGFGSRNNGNFAFELAIGAISAGFSSCYAPTYANSTDFGANSGTFAMAAPIGGTALFQDQGGIPDGGAQNYLNGTSLKDFSTNWANVNEQRAAAAVWSGAAQMTALSGCHVGKLATFFDMDQWSGCCYTNPVGSNTADGFVNNVSTWFGTGNCPCGATNTMTNTNTPTRTQTNTVTHTPTFTQTQTNTVTNSQTNTVTNTQTSTVTQTVTNTVTNSQTATVTNTQTHTVTQSPTNTVTNSATSTVTNTPTNTLANTATNTFTNTVTNTETSTYTHTNTNTVTDTVTNTVTNTITNSQTATVTNSQTNTVTSSPTRTFTNTATATVTQTSTSTLANTATNTATNTVTNTYTSTQTPTDTLANTATNTATVTNSQTNTQTQTNTKTTTNTATNTSTPTVSNTQTDTYTATNTSTDTFVNTPTNTSTSTDTNTITPSPTMTSTATPTNTDTPSSTMTATPTSTGTSTNTDTTTPQNTPTCTFTNTVSNTSTSTSTSTSSFTATNTWTLTNTNTPANTSTNTQTSTQTSSSTSTATFTFTPTPTTGLGITKVVSESQAHAGDVLTYTINVKVTGNNGTGLVVTDTLPAGVSFTGFSGSNIVVGTFNPATDLLQWVMPSPLAVGTYQLSYQTTVNSFLAGNSVLLNNAQLTSPISGSIGASVPVTVVGNYTVKINVYNSAGEVIKSILIKNFTMPINNITLSTSNTITTLQGPGGIISIMYGNTVIGTWDGSNNSGNPVTNGSYLIQVDNMGQNGVVTSVSQKAIVNRSLANISAAVFNGAGEKVRDLYNVINDPLGVNMTNVSLSASTFKAGVNNASPNATPGTSGTMNSAYIYIETSGNPVTLSWDGTTNTGNLVTPGVYTIAVHWNDGSGNTSDISRNIIVIGSYGVSGTVIAKPNVLNTTNGFITTFDAGSVQNAYSIKVRIYATSGQLVKAIQSAPGQLQVQWDTSTGVASGLYVASVEIDGASGGMISRQKLKVLMMH